ncbi:schwannomin-interacting protein 1 [Aplysia californica]|uniref:Schwannomin-interacting protein 1 n=1 Tax=Aplysia californica TaxID=6500 RepID=A0ABM1VZ29_APLCA|nr:schwannomin-interacting protein 1 [Aplysia californica]
MTLLTPEENQGGGDDSSATAPADSEDELDGAEFSSSETTALLPPGREDSSNSNSNSDNSTGANDDGADINKTSTTTSLDPQTVLSSLERTRDKKSPSRFSVDVECESVVSDYSELGGPLKDIERDVHYLDRDTLRSEEGGDSWLELSRQEGEFESEVERREGESQADFEKRIRKINLLSLAQEFAELKKVDAQACAFNFHRNQSVKNLRQSLSPAGSRGQSIERSRRTNSKSPLRASSLAGGGNMPGIMATSGGHDLSQKDGKDGTSSGAENMTTSLPKNYEKSSVAAANQRTEDPPANEARRGDSNLDLPANMRPNRFMMGSPRLERDGSRPANAGSQGNSSDAEGDFDVYNIESTLPHVNWATLEKQLEIAAKEGQNRLESCKNEREEIRRRLAMSTEDETTADEPDPSETLSPRKQRLQDRLQATPSGMQICFMNDDVLDDDEDDNLITARLDDPDNESSSCPESSSEDKSGSLTEASQVPPLPNHPCFPGEVAQFTARQTQLQSEATLALAQASTMARMQLEVEKQSKKKSPIADMVGIPTLGGGRRLRLTGGKLQEMNLAQLQVLVNDLHSQIELLNEDLVHLLIERDDLHMEQDSMLVDIEDLTSHCHDPKTTNNNKNLLNNNRPTSRRDRRK